MSELPTAMFGTLTLQPALDRPDLLAPAVHAALSKLQAANLAGVAAIDPVAADTSAFCERYGVLPQDSANCVVVTSRREGSSACAACVVLASTRADVNGVVRRRLGARKVSFAPIDVAIAETGMEHGGITPVGLPAKWPLLIDPAVAHHPHVVVGGGLRCSKLVLPGRLLLALPSAELVEGLGR
jgi:prolyl-tRNA editing enzyme YbaK/EbsC (Cys-tRNA(Pro) deacylase)